MSDACVDHTFAEEREPSGRLILTPCLSCGMSAMEGLAECQRERDAMSWHVASTPKRDGLAAYDALSMGEQSTIESQHPRYCYAKGFDAGRISERGSVPPMPAPAASHEGAYRSHLHCPSCGTRHVDAGEWATRLHHGHLCEKCGFVWRVEPYTFGVGQDEGVLPDKADREFLEAAESFWMADDRLREAPHVSGLYPPNIERMEAERDATLAQFRKVGNAARLAHLAAEREIGGLHERL